MWLFLLTLFTDTSRVFPVSVAPAESIRVTVTGSGPPVVLVPGLFGAAFGFRNLVPELTAAGFQAIVVEPLGFGSSPRPEKANYSLTAQADRIAAALDSLGIDGAIVVAHSLGASMAFRLAYRRPDLVRGLLSLDGGPTETAATPGFRRAMQYASWVKWMGGERRIRKTIRGYLVDGSGDPSWVTDEVVRGYTQGAVEDLDGTLKAYLRMAASREPEKLVPHLSGIRCPVRLLIGGVKHGWGIRPEEIGLLGQRLAAFSVDTVPGAGAFVYEEQPHRVVQEVLALLAVEEAGRRVARGVAQ
ncbi:MAG: alpha/beta fold hydrolase [Gemmatimonadales bacterium]